MNKMKFLHILYILFGSILVEVSIAQEEANLQILPAGKEHIGALYKTKFFTCRATVPSTDLLTDLKWTGPDGEAIKRETRKYTEKNSADTVLLFIQSLQDEDQGTYNCSAKYAGTQELVTSFELKVYMDITWEDIRTEQHVIINQTAKIECKVKAKPQPNIDWQKDSLPYKTNDRCTIEKDGIVCRPITQQDEGLYVCRARVPATGNMDNRNITVIVDIPPKIDSLSPEYNVIEDEPVTMTCTATGKPIPTVTWVDKNKKDLSQVDGYRVDELSGQLTIEKVSRDDHGIFTCIVENGAGKDEKETRLNVVRKPKIKEFKNITAEKGGEVKLICRVSAEPPAQVTITKKSSQRMFESDQPYVFSLTSACFVKVDVLMMV